MLVSPRGDRERVFFPGASLGNVKYLKTEEMSIASAAKLEAAQ
jgi:hypothetical protein